MGILGHRAWAEEDFFAVGMVGRVQRGGVGTMVVLEEVVDWADGCEGLVPHIACLVLRGPRLHPRPPCHWCLQDPCGWLQKGCHRESAPYGNGRHWVTIPRGGHSWAGWRCLGGIRD